MSGRRGLKSGEGHGRVGPAASRSRAPNPYPSLLPRDPVPWLLGAGHPAITAFVRRDLLGQAADLAPLRELPEPARLLRRQRQDGAWAYPVKKPPPANYDLYQTLNTLGVLVAKWGFDRRHPAVDRAAAYVFSCQAPEGDYRGIYGNQPAHTYTPALMEVLIQAGYATHPSIERAFRWLLATRQEDGGWAIPVRTRNTRLGRQWPLVSAGAPVEADRSRPFSHLVTGMVLRAFACHPRRRRGPEALRAARLLKGRFFGPDKYPDRRGPEYWTRFTYPFQFTDLLTSLDSLGRMGFPADDPDVARAIDWFRRQQRPDGSFTLGRLKGGGDRLLPQWLGLAVCRALGRFSLRD